MAEGSCEAKLLSEQQIAALEAKHPLGLGDPRDVSHASRFSSSLRQAEWITGSTLVVDGGYLAALVVHVMISGSKSDPRRCLIKAYPLLDHFNQGKRPGSAKSIGETYSIIPWQVRGDIARLPAA